MKKLIKNITIWYLIYIITFFSNPIYALNVGGWVKTGTSRSGTTSTYNGSRSYNPNYAGSSATSVASLVPLAVDVGAYALRGTGWGLAVTALGIAYTGYQALQDYQNNRIKLTKTDDGSTTAVYRWKHSQYGGWVYGLSSAVGVAQIWTNALQGSLGEFDTPTCHWTDAPNQSAIECTAKRQQTQQDYNIIIPIWDYNPNYNPNAQPQDDVQYITPTQLGDLVLNQANQGNQNALDLVHATADDAWADNPASPALKAKLQNELNKNANYPSETNASSVTTTQASSTNPNASGTTTTTSHSETQTELPAFCKYATKLCDWLDWSQELPTDDDKQPVDIKENDITFTQTVYISPNENCPAPTVISFGGINIPIDYTMFCNVLAIIKPAIVSVAFISAIFIVSGVRDNG